MPTPDEPSGSMILLEDEPMSHSSLTIAVLTIRQIRRCRRGTMSAWANVVIDDASPTEASAAEPGTGIPNSPLRRKLLTRWSGSRFRGSRSTTSHN